MFDVAVATDVLDYARQVLADYNFGRRRVANGSRQEQLTGLVGELVVQDLFGYPRTDGSSGPDGGMDLVFHGLTIDVKTMRRDAPARPEYVNNFSALQTRSPSRALIFCSLNWNRRVLTVCGWMLKDLFFRVADFHPKGAMRRRTNGTHFRAEADLYEIKNRDLYSPRTLQALHDDLLSISIAEGRCSCQFCERVSGHGLRETALDLSISAY